MNKVNLNIIAPKLGALSSDYVSPRQTDEYTWLFSLLDLISRTQSHSAFHFDVDFVFVQQNASQTIAILPCLDMHLWDFIYALCVLSDPPRLLWNRIGTQNVLSRPNFGWHAHATIKCQILQSANGISLVDYWFVSSQHSPSPVCEGVACVMRGWHKQVDIAVIHARSAKCIWKKTCVGWLQRNVSNVFWKWAGTNGVSVSANKRIEFYYSISIAGGLCCVYPVAIVYGGNLTKTTKHTTTPNRCKLICLLDITMQTRGLHFVFFAAGGGLLFCFRKLLSAIVSFGEIKKVLIPIEFAFPAPQTVQRQPHRKTHSEGRIRGKLPAVNSLCWWCIPVLCLFMFQITRCGNAALMVIIGWTCIDYDPLGA